MGLVARSPARLAGAVTDFETRALGAGIEVVATYNKIPLASVAEPQWGIVGNAYYYESVNYTYASGVLVPANLAAYPLQVMFVPAVPGFAIVQPVFTVAGDNLGEPPGPFETTGTINLTVPGFSPPPNVNFYGTSVGVRDLTLKGQTQSQPWLCMASGAPGAVPNLGISLTLNFTSLVGSGRIYAINLFNILATITYEGITRVSQTTNDQFYYDGNNYPYDTPTPIDAQGNFQVGFVDSPMTMVGGLRKNPGAILDYTFAALTYFFYDDPANGIAPVMLAFPVRWGYMASVSFSCPETWNVTGSILDIDTINDMEPPEWQNHGAD